MGQISLTERFAKRLYNCIQYHFQLDINMLNHQLARKILWMVPLLFLTLACDLVAQLTSSPTFPTTNPTAQSPSPSTAESIAVCTALFEDVLNAGAGDGKGGNSPATFGSDHEIHYLIVYDTPREELGNREDLLLPEDVDQKFDSRAAHEAIWHTFTSIIPEQNRSFVTEFAVLSDGSNNVLAGVSPTYDNPHEWTLKIDVVDAANPYSLDYSLLHEYGHLLTLNASQVPPDEQVFYHPDDQAIYENAVSSCPQYFTGEGCSNSGSYINQFFHRYWSSFYMEWQKIQGQEVRRDLLYNFYSIYADQFLTSYAATSPEEDIAESWAFFLLSPRPEPTSIANQKILFFYEYPELVALRQEILDRLCASRTGS